MQQISHENKVSMTIGYRPQFCITSAPGLDGIVGTCDAGSENTFPGGADGGAIEPDMAEWGEFLQNGGLLPESRGAAPPLLGHRWGTSKTTPNG